MLFLKYVLPTAIVLSVIVLVVEFGNLSRNIEASTALARAGTCLAIQNALTLDQMRFKQIPQSRIEDFEAACDTKFSPTGVSL